MLILAISLLALAALPTALTIVNLAALHTPRLAPTCATMAVLIPARDEANNIARCVEHALASRDVDLSVIVLDDHSTDGTAAIVEKLAAGDPRLRIELAPPLPTGWSGKQHACHALAQLCAAPTAVFVDADVCLTPDAVARLAGALERADLVSGVPRQMMPSLPERLIIPMINGVLLGYLPIPLARRDNRPALGAACGQLIAVRMAAYRTAGGHAAIRRSLHDGLALPRLFRASGLKTDLVAGAELASCRMYDGWPAVIAGVTKNATEGMARPMALPVWTVLLIGGHVAPWVALPFAIARGDGVASLVLALAAAGPIVARIAQSARCREPLDAVVLHPLGVTLLVALQWLALWRRFTARAPTWRGRSYPSAP